jgi:hypothetical protein
MYRVIKFSFFLFFLFSFYLHGNSQTLDTIYVDQIDTVLVKEPDVILHQTYYKEQLPEKKNRKFELQFSIGGNMDFSHYEVCKECETNFNHLKSAYSNTKSTQLGLQLNYLYKRFSFGFDMNYRNSVKSINYNNDTIKLKTHFNVNYFMVGPSISYKIIRKSKWEIDLYSSVLFSFTTKQTGETIGGASIDKIVNINTDKIISERNILYHFAPVISYNINTTVSLSIIAHYYFDLNSNISQSQNYTEQRNTIGVSFGIKYRL